MGDKPNYYYLRIMIRKVYTPEGLKVSDIPLFFKEEGIEFESIDVCNWPDQFPYKPEVKFAIAHCSDAILVDYRVEEQGTAARADKDQGNVWEDSCVEFFVSPCLTDGLYYNIESNCIGRLKLCCGLGREGRVEASHEILRGVKRCSSLGSEPFEEKNVGAWELSLIIPVSTFWKHDVRSLEGTTMKANFYKCGDKLSVPHFLSYAPIDTASPDFHRPEFFVPITFE